MEDADVVRKLYTAMASRDFATMGSCFAPGVVWHMPGKSTIAGDHRGWPAIRDDFLARLGPLSGGTFRAELLDLAVGEDYAVAVQRATGDHQGRRLDVTGCQLIAVEDGLITQVRGHYSDLYAVDAFWGSGS